jgi:hypothetical protein
METTNSCQQSKQAIFSPGGVFGDGESQCTALGSVKWVEETEERAYFDLLRITWRGKSPRL